MRFRGAGQFSRLLAERADVVLGDAAAVRRAYRVLWAKSALVILWTMASYLLLLRLESDGPQRVAHLAGSLGLLLLRDVLLALSIVFLASLGVRRGLCP